MESKLNTNKQIGSSAPFLFSFATMRRMRDACAQGKGTAWTLVPEGPDDNSHG